jgi:ABC-type transport system involved in cytochrome c biogenesis permease subunit
LNLNLHAVTEALYLAAAVLATFGLAIRQPRLSRAAVGALAAGAIVHAAAFLQIHEFRIPPRLTGLPGAVSLAAWLGTLFFLALVRRPKFDALVVVVAPAAFLGAFFGSMSQGVVVRQGAPVWGQAHVLLASAGIALLGVAGAAGLLFLAQRRSLKRKASPPGRGNLPPLEALDRVNALAISVGFLLLSLALVTGVLWTLESEGRPWPRSPHANAALLAWAIYAVLVGARWLARQGATRSAQSAVAGFAVLLAAVVGVGMLL